MAQLRLALLAPLAGLALAASGCSRAQPTASCKDFVKNGAETDIDCGGICGPCGIGKGCSVVADCIAPAVCTSNVCLPAGCSDRARNGTETDVDCGGGACVACKAGQACLVETDCVTKSCVAGKCGDVMNACTDGIQNGSETDVDCGGSCTLKCATGKKCGSHTDCSSGICNSAVCSTAPIPSCTDNVLNGNETDVDCGGSCSKCADGKKCQAGTDCSSTICAGGLCVPVTCANGTQDGTEPDIDCGGLCPLKCAGGKKCVAAADCASKICAGNLCTTPNCQDKILNGDESDVDCGGSACAKCPTLKTCAASTDCQSGVCLAKVCQAPSCTDGVKNGTEGDIDCGSGCPAKCAVGKKCGIAADCVSVVCTSGICAAPTCTDKVKNGAEPDVDCGGPCVAKCGDGRGCFSTADCMSLLCTAGICATTCANKAVDGTESDVDCGGVCPKCGTGLHCKVGSDCASLVCQATTKVCLAPTCTDGVQNQGEGGIDCGGPCTACGGTCPMLYTWDGTGMQFESDMFPRGMLGIKYAAGFVKPNPNDYYMLRHQPAAGADGLFDLRLIEERLEVDYIDQARLYAVDVPAGLDVYSEILFVGTSYVAPDKMVHTVAVPQRQLPAAKHVEAGQDVTSALASSDGQLVTLGVDRNDASWNTLELDLGDQAAAPRIKLVIDARSMMPSSVDGQLKATAKELPGATRTLIQVRDATGAWVDVPKATVALPIPKELPRPFVLDITSAFVADRQKVRLKFLYKTYVDSIRFDTTVDQPVTIAELPLAAASLAYHGVDMPASPSELTLYVYGAVYPVKPYPYFPGLYTAFTEVSPLLKSVDDMFVIFGPGDELALKYGPEPARPAGVTRRYLFYTNGYYKSDKAVSIPSTVAPLPFAAMSSFPYDPAVESYPTDPAHQSYLSTYNTRQQ